MAKKKQLVENEESAALKKLEKKTAQDFDTQSLEDSVKKLIFGIVTVLVILIALLMVTTNIMAMHTKTVRNRYMNAATSICQATTSLNAVESCMNKAIADPTSLESNAEYLAYSDENVSNMLDAVIKEADRYTTQITACQSDYAKIQETLEAVKAAIQENDKDGALVLMNEQYVPAVQELGNKLAAVLEECNSGADKYVLATELSKDIIGIACIVIVILLLLKIRNVVATFIKSLRRPLDQVGNSMDKMSQGDLDIEMDYEGTNELGHMAEKINETSVELKSYIESIDGVLENLAAKNFNVDVDMEYRGMFSNIKESMLKIIVALNDTMKTIVSSTDGVDHEASQIASASQMLAESVTEQASTVEELLATITDVTDQERENAANVKKVSENSISAKEIIDVGNEKMEQLIGAMTDIHNAASQISQILGVIQGISDQTNLLSLNASIEAARAGEAGKGFAVVAGEIGQLAKQTNDATKTTEELIKKSVDAVEIGNHIVTDTADILHQVVDASTEINVLAVDVAEAAEMQTTSLGEITKAVQQISEVIQTISATAEETSASSQELKSHVDVLENMMEEFELKA